MTSMDDVYDNVEINRNKSTLKNQKLCKGDLAFSVTVSIATLVAVTIGVVSFVMIQDTKSKLLEVSSLTHQQMLLVKQLQHLKIEMNISENRWEKLTKTTTVHQKQLKNITMELGMAEAAWKETSENLINLQQRNKVGIEDLNFIIKTHNREQLCYAGVKDGRVRDQDMSSSSFFGSGYKAHYGRLDNTGEPNGFWWPQTHRAGEWIQVDFREPTRIVGVITQGRPSGRSDWVTSYKIAYGNSTSSLQTIQSNSGNDKIFQGNQDINTHVTNMFPELVTARYFRLIVQTFHRAITFRIEYLIC